MVTATYAGTATRKPRRARRSRRASRRGAVIIALRLGVLALIVVLWQVLSGRLLPEYAVSKPTDVVRVLGDTLSSQQGWLDIKTTAVEILAGFALGTAVGSFMGLVLGSFPLLGQVLEPLIAALNGIPKIALAPLFLLFFGIGEWSKITIAATGVAFVVFYNLYMGLRLRERELVESVQLMGGRTHHVLGYVTLPTLVSPFFTALKTAGPLAIIGVIGGEFVASSQGVGHQLFTAATNLDAAAEFSGLIILVVMTLVLNGILNQLDAFVIRRLGLADGRTKGRSSARGNVST